MQTTYTGHVTQAEWRWVFLLGIILLLFSFSPFVIIAIFSPPGEEWQFVGALHDYQDTAASIARVRQGQSGAVLVQFLQTPEQHQAALVHPLYALIGQISRFTFRSPVWMFHITRLAVSLLMYMSIYQLGANIWVKIGTRRTFFVVAVLGSGFGWVVALMTGLTGEHILPDLSIPQAFPFYSATVSVHYPIAIILLSSLASGIIMSTRPGATIEPSVDNYGIQVFLASLLLVLVYPDALLPLFLAFISTVSVQIFQDKEIKPRDGRWILWFIVPALPLLAYYFSTFQNNMFFASWVNQRGTETSSMPMLIIGLGLPLIISLPALYRAARRLEADGDRFMIFWLIMMIGSMYSPLPSKQYFIAGIMLPISYFATRSIQDFWFEWIRRKYRTRVYVVIVPLMVLSHVVWLFVPIMPILQGWSEISANVVERDYTDMFHWLAEHTTSEDVILTEPRIGAWIPAIVGARPVYGHYAETYEAQQKRQAVLDWYRSEGDACSALLETYSVDYVIWGPREQRIGSGACISNLKLEVTSGDVAIYSIPQN